MVRPNRRPMKRFGLALSLVAVLLVTSASPAPAATTIGETFTPANPCFDRTRLQTTSPGSRYIVPSTGGITAWTLTSWSFQAGPTPPSLKLKVGRPAGGNNFTIIGESGFVTPPANALTSFPVQIPVRAGDIIGNRSLIPAQNCGRNLAAGSGYNQHYVEGEVGLGTTATFLTQDDFQIDISAVLVPSNTFSLGTVKRNKKRGTATITVNVPNAGQLALSGKGVKSASAVATAAGGVKLKIKASGKKRTTLNDIGKVSVTPKVTYTPTGGSADTESRKVKLKKN
jgi:hypothetical protein